MPAPVEIDKQKLIQLLGAGLSIAQVRRQLKCGSSVITRARRKFAVEICALKNKLQIPPTPTYQHMPPQTTVVFNDPPVPQIDSPVNPLNITIPILDPTKDNAEQLKSIAWQVVAAGATGVKISATQRDMVNIIIKASEKHKPPPPANRTLKFHIDQIDIVGDDFKVIDGQVYEVKV